MRFFTKMNNVQRIVWLALTGVTFSVVAEEKSGLYDMSLEELFNVEVEIASKTNESIVEAPSSVTVFDRVRIRQLGLSSVEELLQFVPGFVVSREHDGASSRISVRGRSTQASESVLVLLNGQRVNTLYTGSSTRVLPNIPLENVYRVEVIRGPGSAIYGSHAFTGVVNIITGADTNEVFLKLGTHNRKELAVNSSTVINDIHLSGFFKYRDDDGQQYGDVVDRFGHLNQTSDPFKSIDVDLNMQIDSLNINLRHSSRNNENFIAFGGIDDSINSRHHRFTSLAAKYQYQVNSDLTMMFKAGFRRDEIDEAFLVRKLGMGADQIPMIAGPNLQSELYSSDISANYKLSENNELIIGGLFEKEAFREIKATYSFNPVTLELFEEPQVIDDMSLLFIPDRERRVTGFYVQDKYTPTDDLTLFVGGRWDDYNDFGSSYNPRASIIYNLTDDTDVKVMYGKAFRAPSFVELYNYNAPTRVGNPELDAEEVETTEVALYQKFSSGKASITYFHSDFSDIIVLGRNRPDIDTNPFLARQYESSDKSLNLSGFEMDFEFLPFDGLYFMGSLTHMTKNGRGFPDTSGSVMMDYRIDGYGFNLNGLYRGKIDDFEQSSYWVWNSNFSYQFSDWEGQVGVTNIFEKHYQSFSTTIPDGIPNRGREFFAKIIWAF